MKVRLLLLLILVILSGCSLPNVDETKPTVDRFYSVMNTKDYLTINSMLDERWFEETSKEETRQLFDTLSSNFGTALDYERVNWQFKTLVGTNSGTYYTLNYKTHRSIRDTTDTFVLFRRRGSETFSVLGYHSYASILDNETAPSELQ